MLSLIAALALAMAEPAPPSASPPTAAATSGSPASVGPVAKPTPLTPQQAVDPNGVPAWAKRKHKHAVQGCETRPGIGIETWRQNYDSQGISGLKPRPPQAKCR